MRVSIFLGVAPSLVCLSMLLGCGAEKEAAPLPKTPQQAQDQTPAQPAPHVFKFTGRFQRQEITQILPDGPAWLLRSFWPEEVVADGKFIGWRLVLVPAHWQGIDLRPGDVITSVNGRSLRTDDEMVDVWARLSTVAEIRVAYERDGQPKELVIPIDGPPDKDLEAILLAGSPPSRRAAPKKPGNAKGVIVIREDNAPSDPDGK